MYFKTNMSKKAIKLMLRTTLEKMGYKNISLKPLQIIEDFEDVVIALYPPLRKPAIISCKAVKYWH